MERRPVGGGRGSGGEAAVGGGAGVGPNSVRDARRDAKKCDTKDRIWVDNI